MATRNNAQADNRDGLPTQSDRLDRLEHRMDEHQHSLGQIEKQLQDLTLALQNTRLIPASFSPAPPILLHYTPATRTAPLNSKATTPPHFKPVPPAAPLTRAPVSHQLHPIQQQLYHINSTQFSSPCITHFTPAHVSPTAPPLPRSAPPLAKTSAPRAAPAKPATLPSPPQLMPPSTKHYTPAHFIPAPITHKPDPLHPISPPAVAHLTPAPLSIPIPLHAITHSTESTKDVGHEASIEKVSTEKFDNVVVKETNSQKSDLLAQYEEKVDFVLPPLTKLETSTKTILRDISKAWYNVDSHEEILFIQRCTNSRSSFNQVWVNDVGTWYIWHANIRWIFDPGLRMNLGGMKE